MIIIKGQANGHPVKQITIIILNNKNKYLLKTMEKKYLT